MHCDPTLIPDFLTALQTRFTLEDSRIVDQARLKGWSTQVFERTFAATAALNSLTLCVAGVALFTKEAIQLLANCSDRFDILSIECKVWAYGTCTFGK